MKIPKLPSRSPIPKGTPPPQPLPLAFGGGSDSGPTAGVPDSPKVDPGGDEKRRRKEGERVAKWMMMMSVRRRDQGGNIAEWQWRRDAQGTKVSPEGGSHG